MHKTFTELDRDRFLDAAFDFMARFSENSLNELETRHPGIETAFKRIDARRFTASVYRNGSSLTCCNIRLGGLRGGIAFSYGGDPDDNSMNESLSVETDEQSLFLRPLGVQMRGSSEQGSHLGPEGAAEYYWGPIHRTAAAVLGNRWAPMVA
jgi:hypothetical protein